MVILLHRLSSIVAKVWQVDRSKAILRRERMLRFKLIVDVGVCEENAQAAST
jgi:hypothetical protein